MNASKTPPFTPEMSNAETAPNAPNLKYESNQTSPSTMARLSADTNPRSSTDSAGDNYNALLPMIDPQVFRNLDKPISLPKRSGNINNNTKNNDKSLLQFHGTPLSQI